MTKTQTAKVATTPDVDQFNVVTAIKGLIARGNAYTFATKAAIAHVLATEFADGKVKRGVASKLATDTGMNKGDVSRIARILTDDSKARRAAMGVDVLHIDDNEATLAAAVKVGELFKRETVNGKKVKNDGTVTENEGTVTKSADKSESVDTLALIDEWLRTATPKQYAARVAAITALLAQVDSDRATAQAESDAQAEIAA